LRAVAVDLGHLVEGVALDPRAEPTHVVAQRRGLVVEVDEDEPLPHLAAHGHQAELREVELEELGLLLDEGEGALEVVAPAVVLAGELATGAAGLLAGVVLPHQLVAPVTADVVEGTGGATDVAHDDDRGAGGVELAGEVAAR